MRIIFSLLKRSAFFILLMVILSCSENKPTENNNKHKIIHQNNEKVYAKAIKLETGWGYDIYMDNKRYIHQYIIPDVSGVYTFETKEKALKAANLVVKKIVNGIIPPFVTVKELDSIDVLPKRAK